MDPNKPNNQPTTPVQRFTNLFLFTDSIYREILYSQCNYEFIWPRFDILGLLVLLSKILTIFAQNTNSFFTQVKELSTDSGAPPQEAFCRKFLSAVGPF